MRDRRIATITRRLVDVLDPCPRRIAVDDIAYGLASAVRFGNQCPQRHTVAQHSVHVARMMARDKAPPLAVLHGLLHDAHEAYLGDLPAPIKPMVFYCRPTEPLSLLGSHYTLESRALLESRWQMAILQALDIPEPDAVTIDLVAHYDRVAYCTEVRDLWGPRTEVSAWDDYDPSEADHQPLGRVLAPHYAEAAFLFEFADLIGLAGQTEEREGATDEHGSRRGDLVNLGDPVHPPRPLR
ncbi:MAG TPA: hypothetical protein VMY35_14980 [Phycisphaerae bacterium]|nr:hypothetical protein [Phycisphaerae bacterium]